MCCLIHNQDHSLSGLFILAENLHFRWPIILRRNSMFKLSEIIKKSDAEKLEQLKKKLKKWQSPHEAVLFYATK